MTSAFCGDDLPKMHTPQGNSHRNVFYFITRHHRLFPIPGWLTPIPSPASFLIFKVAPNSYPCLSRTGLGDVDGFPPPTSLGFPPFLPYF